MGALRRLLCGIARIIRRKRNGSGRRKQQHERPDRYSPLSFTSFLVTSQSVVVTGFSPGLGRRIPFPFEENTNVVMFEYVYGYGD